MADHKPLPALPSSVTLAVDARRHRSQLIRHFLSETHDSGIEQRVEGWAVVLEDVLDEMGHSLAADEWLGGFRRSRELQRDERRRRQAAAQEVLQLKMAAKAKGGASGTTRNPDGSSEGKQIAETIVKELPEFPAPSTARGRQLLLCVGPPGTRIPVPSEDAGFDIVPANIGCSFVAGAYTIQETAFPTILYGARELALPTGEGVLPQVVGGTFTFKGVISPPQHQHLFNVLRISVCVHLSLLLEQYLFLDSHIPLIFPRPPLPSPSPSVPINPAVEHRKSRHKKRKSLIPSGIFSFFSKSSLSRSSTISPVMGLHNALHMATPPSTEEEHTPRSSLDLGIGRFRRISIMGDRRSPMKKPPSAEETSTPFTTTLKQVQSSQGLLSTSLGVSFAPPKLLVDIAKAEEQNQPYRLRGDQKTGLGSLLGWNGKENLGKGMSGTLGFLHHQEFSVLVARRVPSDYSASPESETQVHTEEESTSSSLASTASLASSIQVVKPHEFVVCGQPKWKTYRYYSKDVEEDVPIGEAIWDFVWAAQMSCEQPGCRSKRGQHETRLIHGGVSIAVDIEEKGVEEDEGPEAEADRIDMWQSCKVCQAKSERNEMSVGTYLMSFGKFLELLVYSPVLATFKPALCEHTTPPPHPWPNLPASRYNIVRHFSTKSHTVSFSCSALENVFEIRVPRLQIIRGNGGRSSRDPSVVQAEGSEAEEERRLLRREIKRWWEGVADHMDKVEKVLASDEERMRLKALPRLPSSDDSYEELDTPKPSMMDLPDSIPGLPAPPSTPVKSSWKEHERTPAIESSPGAPEAPPPTPMKSAQEQTPAERLASLRHTFHRTEQSLYGQLGRTQASSLNDVRRSFMASAKGAQKRLCAWQKKHIYTVAAPLIPDRLVVKEPEWWGKKCHAVHGSNAIVREDDWGSIISYTLSTTDYQRELASLSFTRLASTSNSSSADSEVSSTPPTQSSSSFFSAAMGYRLFAPSNLAQPDPDLDDVAWSEPEAFSSVISRKGHPRDSANIIKEVLRQNSKFQGEGSRSPSSASTASLPLRFGTFGTGTGQRLSGLVPPSAWAKADVQVSRDEADGRVVVVSDAVEEVGKILEHEAGKGEKGETFVMSRPGSRASGSVASLVLSGTGGGRAEGAVGRGHKRASLSSSSSSLSSFVSADSDMTIGKDSLGGAKLTGPPQAPPLPPKDEPSSAKPRQSVEVVHPPPQVHPLPAPIPVPASANPALSSFSFASTLTSGFGSAMRFMLRDHDSTSRPTSPLTKGHHGLLSAEPSGIDERPHIKHDWTVGKRLKFSCTVYYAKQFDGLRKRCGIDDVFAKSLSRSANWAAEGGKSRSAFWKTSDDRFIIKTLVDAWNVADLQVLLEMAPSYFRYMDATASRATVLAKVVGFYTVEIRNLETGAVQSKADLLVMENLFYHQKISKAFDFKGVQGRKAKAAKVSTNLEKPKTFFDGEWIEGQQKAMMLVRAHSKYILRSALRNDADFLSKSNIMDYSLLVAVNEEEKELACGLVDTIGSYTFAKTLEYKAKHGLNSGKDITVMPPAEYEERFINALEGYFLACPDKWSKPLDESKIISDIGHLPSVL